MKDPSRHYVGDRPYMDYREYLEELLAYLDVYLLDILGSQRYRGRKETSEGGPWRRAEQFLLGRLADRGLTEKQSLTDWNKAVTERRQFTLDIGRPLLLERILDRLLSCVPGMAGEREREFMRLVLIFALAAALQKDYGLVLDVLTGEERGGAETLERMGHGIGDTRLTLGLCVRLFAHPGGLSDREVYQQAARYFVPLSRMFPSMKRANQMADGVMVCDARLLDILMGKNDYMPEATETFYAFDDPGDPLMHREGLLKQLQSFMNDEEMPLTLLWGPRGAGKHHLLRHGAVLCRKDLVFFNAAQGADGGISRIQALMAYAIRECFLFNRIFVAEGIETLTKEQARELAGWLNNEVKPIVSHIFMISETENYEDDIRFAFALEMKEPEALERIELWKYFLRDESLAQAENFRLESLANTFIITPGQIKGAIAQAKLMGREQGQILEDHLYRACYIQLDHQLAQKAARIKPAFGWDDLKLDASDKAVLRDVCNCIKNRHTVLGEWNFQKIIPYGGGITVLFSGPPGTGKTMAAQVIAHELHMELYKIDLSQVIDKYVGETEKNIRLIFEQAKKSNSILFFDEADSVFGKRMEASNANERFANIESSLLLQCIEEYRGMTILATNNFSAIDGAFIRRFKYYLLFKEPDEALRRDIWCSVFPQEAPVSKEVDFGELAHIFQFTGAVIKNVALSAAYMAAEEGREIGLVDILKSARREMAKNNLILTKEKLGSLAYLYEDMMREGPDEE